MNSQSWIDSWGHPMKRLFVGGIAIVWFLVGWIPGHAQIPSIRVNEILASNATINTDRYGKYSDWIELVNLGAIPISLEGFFITDDPGEPTKWTFPSVEIPAKGYLLVWASKKDKYIDGELHTNFKLSSGGEFVGLYDPTGSVVDTVTFGEQQTDISYGRMPDGTGPFQSMNEPTPCGKNKKGNEPGHPLSFSPTSRFFQDELVVSLLTNIENGEIYFTTDGSHVDLKSHRYQSPLHITETTVVRARVFKKGEAVSKDISQIYVKGYNGTLPIISYATDNKNLFGDQGIFDHPEKTGREWEKPVSVNFLELNGNGFQINAGIRIHGGLSRRRAYPKQSTRLYFRSAYGKSKLIYRLFPSKRLDEFDRLIIHSGGSSDQYYLSWGNHLNPVWTLLRDPLNHHLLKEIGGIVSASRPVVLLVNGKIWGIFHIRERIDDFYLESNFKIKNADLLQAHGGKGIDIKEGDSQNWDKLMDFFNTHSLTDPKIYDRAANWVNIKNMTDYFILNIFVGNWDMPHNNTYMMRERKDSAKWNYILWDTDVSYGSSGNPVEINILEWATRDHPITRYGWSHDDSEANLWSTLVLRKLLDNPNYRNYFINRFCDLMNSTLSSFHVSSVVDSLAAILAPNIKFEHQKWPEATVETWTYGVSQIKNWVEKRPWHQREHLKDKFHISGDVTVTLNATDKGGSVKINTLRPVDCPWTGHYFKSVPIQLEAIPFAGYEFAGWGNSDFPDTNVVERAFDSDVTVNARFVRKTSLHSVLINEIMASNDTTIADEDGDYPDWLELVNTNSWDVSLKGYFLTDDKDEPNKWVFPDTMIKGNGYLLIWASKKDRKGPGELHTNFKISAKKEYLGFYTPGGEVMDSITVRKQETDISYARIPDGEAEFKETITPTPGASNVLTEPFLTGRGKVSYYFNNGPIFGIMMGIGLKSGEVERIEISGDFQYDRLKAGENYYFVPSKTSEPEDKGVVRMYDAALVARYSVGLIEFTPIQQVVGDADRNGIISMYDAAKIARFSVGLSVPDPCYVGQWGFEPDTIEVDKIHAAIEGINFMGYIVGDVSGKWHSGGLEKSYFAEGGKKQFKGQIQMRDDTLIISLKPDRSMPVYSSGIDLSYDPGEVRYLGAIKADEMKGVTAFENSELGRIRFGYFNLEDVTGMPGAIWLRFKRIRDVKEYRKALTVHSYYVNGQQIFKGDLYLSEFGKEKPKKVSISTYPNPFNSTTKITFVLAKPEDVVLSVYNEMGALVWKHILKEQPSGEHSFLWQARDNEGQILPTGIYFLKIKGNGWSRIKKMLYLR